MIKAIIFDFDGVILDSMDIKTYAFKELFSSYPNKINKIINYHLKNDGISRYVKFEHIYKKILKRSFSNQNELIELGENFSKIVNQKILKVPFIPGTKEFLNKNSEKYYCFIASATPEKELHQLLLKKKINRVFKEIHGSPKEKLEIIKDIMHRYNFLKSEIVFIGDSFSDKITAKKSGVYFIERNAKLSPKLKNNSLFSIPNLWNLEKTLNYINLLT